MQTQLKSRDGHELNVWIEPATGEAKGGVIILQEIFGVTEQLKGVARRYADLGYLVAVPALFDRVAAPTVIPFEQPQQGLQTVAQLSLENTVADIAAVVDYLGGQNLKVGVVGFCWGGGLALRCAQTLDIHAAVSFYGTRLPEYLGLPLKAPFQGHFGRVDGHTPKDVIDQVQRSLPEIEVYWYDAGHAFANDARPSYMPEAAGLAHARAASFFERYLTMP
ncbi:dienelactone hydrolase family protein [Reinekea sp. G2M2-21]|uniref:dienelactone hydrolase family protein n=1 Tax=Reinekea sp. G2M2-21 TaxID=2788942 RepID=UPI0018AAD549|nr:dienelactone hydrolase family protein [Reinekea sp. G2M2-21]